MTMLLVACLQENFHNLSVSLHRSPFLEGRWNFEWFGDSSPGALAARLLFEYVLLLDAIDICKLKFT
jgi:hypothetical protein